GPGGTGKTRLALEVAAGLQTEFPDGVFFIPLASIRDEGLVVPAVVRTLNLPEQSGQSPLDALTTYLPGKRLLLVLDSFEQVAGAASEIAALLQAAPTTRALITSRSPLRIRGEQEYPVPPLTLPEEATDVLPEQLLEYESVKLFQERAQAVKPAFRVTAENGAAIVEICRRLDGLPLAIELAAARVKLMSPGLVLSHLEDRFELLTEGPRDVPRHQQTLRGAFDWSYDLMTAEEQTLFRHLCVFVGGFSLEAAEWICRPVVDPEFHLLDGLASLVDKSLLRQTETSGEARFEMLETIREYGWMLLEESGEVEALRQRHAEYFVSLAERAEPLLGGPDQAVWFDRLESEHPNAQAVLEWALEKGQIEVAVRFGNALWWFWWVRGHFGEMRHRVELGLAQSAMLSRAQHATLLVASGAMMSMDGDHERAVQLFEEAVALERDRRDKTGVPRALRSLGFGLSSRGEYGRASALFEEALALDREIGNVRGESAALRALGKMETYQGNYERAGELFASALALDKKQDDRHSMAFSLRGLGDVARYLGDSERASRLYGEALELYRELGSKPGIAYSLQDLADAGRDRGELQEAGRLYDDALDLLLKLGNRRRIATCLAGLAALSLAEGKAESAARLYGVIETLSETVRAPLPPARRAQLDSDIAA
ncbi:MAG TPA: tetratricopeptide repeat protein, partial [Thermoanaerobaculia bacterium]|nr:tetratricopeptide repeat protein [Thermoanaerobaculia bacterium]